MESLSKGLVPSEEGVGHHSARVLGYNHIYIPIAENHWVCGETSVVWQNRTRFYMFQLTSLKQGLMNTVIFGMEKAAQLDFFNRSQIYWSSECRNTYPCFKCGVLLKKVGNHVEARLVPYLKIHWRSQLGGEGVVGGPAVSHWRWVYLWPYAGLLL